MNNLKFVGLFVAGLIVGGLAMAKRDWYVFKKGLDGGQATAAFEAGIDAEILARLRLNEPQEAIKELEQFMDGSVVAISKWDSVTPANNETRSLRDRWLTSVKVYYESYPNKTTDSDLVTSFLTHVPGRNPKNPCENAVCRLDDLRLASSTPKKN